MHPGARFRALLAQPGAIVAPGAYDCASARLIEQAGFPVVYLSGNGASASQIGRPDLGLLTQTEMASHGHRVAMAVDVPVLADADTGYGNALNVMRTVQEYEAAGLAGCHIEDQLMPKRCGFLAGTEVIGRDEFLGKIRAALAARRSADFVVIARTDARSAVSPQEAVDRINAALAAGADLGFITGLSTPEALAEAATLVNGPLMANLGGPTPHIRHLTPADYEAMGYKFLVLPTAALMAAIHAVRTLLTSYRETGTLEAMADRMASFDEFMGLTNLTGYQSLEAKFMGAFDSLEASGERTPNLLQKA